MDTPRARDRKLARHQARSGRRGSPAHRVERRTMLAATAPTPELPTTIPSHWRRSAPWLMLPMLAAVYAWTASLGPDVPELRSAVPAQSSSVADAPRAGRVASMSQMPRAAQSSAQYSVPPRAATRVSYAQVPQAIDVGVIALEPAPATPLKRTVRAPVSVAAIASALPRNAQSLPGRGIVDEAPETVMAPVAVDQVAVAVPDAPNRKSWVRFSRLTFPPHPRNPQPVVTSEPPAIMAALPPPTVAETASSELSFCSAPASLSLSVGPQRTAMAQPGAPSARDPRGLGRMISDAAVAQINDLVVYRAAYSRIAFPMGDVSPMFGVCTDVVIRALREVGIDLQEQVQRTRTGNGDTNIDHRRVDTLKRYFALHGETAPISEFAEDYQPGDIVTYFRPWNRSTTTHIAVVSHVIAPSGRPMIVHNRGWGAQLEDALLVDRITGHYRVLTTGQPVAAKIPGTRVATQTSQTTQAASPLSLRRIPTATTTAARVGG